MIFFHIFSPFTGNSDIRISLLDEGSPFLWLKVFFCWDDELIISVNSRSKPICTSVVQLSPHSQDCSYKGVAKDKMWTYLGMLFMIKIDRPPEIVDCWFTKPLFCTLWYGQKCFFAFFNRFLNLHILPTRK